MSVLFPKMTVRASLDFDSLLLPSFLVATTAQQRGGPDQTPYPASPPHHEPSSLCPSSVIVVDHRATRRSAPPAHGRKERNGVQRPDDQRASPPGPSHRLAVVKGSVSTNVFHRCCSLGRAKSTVLVSLTVWTHPSISAVLGVTAHNPAHRIITQVCLQIFGGQ